MAGAAHLFPTGFGAWLDRRGDLFVDQGHAERLTDHVAVALDPDGLAEVERRRDGACTALLERVELARAEARRDEDGYAAELAALAEAVSTVVAFALLAKFAPGGLHRRLLDEGDQAPPPFPDPSPGGRLAVELMDVARRTAGLGFPPDRLERAWPDVPVEVADLVFGFCDRQTGFGPVPWEAPGYETPGFAVARMRAAFGTAFERPPSGAPPGAGHAAQAVRPGTTRSFLAGWLEFLELEIWYVRRAFYRGMAPLIRRLAEQLDVRAELLLFAEPDEILQNGRGLADAETRRRRYLQDRDYLGAHQVDEARLALATGFG